MTSPSPQPADDAPVLRAQNLHRVLGAGEAANHVLRGVDLAIPTHAYVSIVGASGSGKSTLLYLLGALDRPTRQIDGQRVDPPSAVFVQGQDTSTLDDQQLAQLRNRSIGFVFQFHYLLKEFSALENVCLPMEKAGRPRAAALERGMMLLRRLGLDAKANRAANRLSGGEQQRVALARALANEPAVLLADEPTGNLDKHNTAIIADIFDELAVGGQAIVMVTHDQALAHRARRIVTMEDGLIIRDEPR
jgi:lipoprotein-releasing system ATP-binding protein